MKTFKEVVELRDVILSFTKTLPDRDLFGDSNEEEKQEMAEQYRDLCQILEGRKPLREDVISWYEGNDDYFLKDYLP